MAFRGTGFWLPVCWGWSRPLGNVLTKEKKNMQTIPAKSYIKNSVIIIPHKSELPWDLWQERYGQRAIIILFWSSVPSLELEEARNPKEVCSPLWQQAFCGTCMRWAKRLSDTRRYLWHVKKRGQAVTVSAAFSVQYWPYLLDSPRCSHRP